ncbi:MAG: hypothetical protein LIO77_00500 [Rikenellaceae bacterium]|nr:hypothetical protein [Rikenellaceae bacterium]
MNRSVLCLFIASVIGYAALAQTNETYVHSPLEDYNADVYHPISLDVTLKSSHLWRGLEVSSSALAAMQTAYTDRSGQFTMGVWAGAAFNGKFKEFDYFLSYTYKGFNVAVWDIYNFSPGASYNIDDAFNYKARETGHFIDVQVNYTLQGNYPFQIGWATVVYGRDRGTDNRRNLYSTYVWTEMPIWRDGFVDLDGGIAGAFALKKQSGVKDIFYGKRAGIVNVNLTASKNVVLGNYVLPVSLTTMWNPVNNYTNVMLAVKIF